MKPWFSYHKRCSFQKCRQGLLMERKNKITRKAKEGDLSDYIRQILFCEKIRET